MPHGKKKRSRPKGTFLHALQTKERNLGREQHNGTPSPRKSQPLNRAERSPIEALLKAKQPPSEIAALRGGDVRTIQREIRRGEVPQLKPDLTQAQVYPADRAQEVHDLPATAKEPSLKNGSHQRVVDFIAQKAAPPGPGIQDRPPEVADREKLT